MVGCEEEGLVVETTVTQETKNLEVRESECWLRKWNRIPKIRLYNLVF